ncbi:hypothetical protein MRX96_026697 [Rhipicephalus microplus]
MVPPTYLHTAVTAAAQSNPYKDNLDSIFTYLPAYSDKWPLNTQRAVAVGLHGIWYTPCTAGPIVNNRPANYSLGNICGSSCQKYKITRKNQITSIIKICQAKKSATNVTNLMAAVDIQFEDYNNTCGHGRYPRLYMLRQLSAFLSHGYTSPDKEAECLSN